MSAPAGKARERKAPAPDAGGDSDGYLQQPRTRVRAGTLAAALKDVVGLVGGGDTIPILADVLLSVIDGRITVTATDMDMWGIRDLASNDLGEPDSAQWKQGIRAFTVALPGKALAKVIGSFDADAMVEIIAPHGDEARAVVKAGRSRFRLSALPGEDYPLLTARTAEICFDLECGALLDMVDRVGTAMSAETTRYYLNGIFWHIWQIEGGAPQLRLAATDGNRLIRFIDVVPEGAMAMGDMIVSRFTINELRGLLSAAIKAAPEGAAPRVQISVSEDAKWISFDLPAADGGDVTLSSKLIDGNFPDYQRVIPTGNRLLGIFQRGELSAAIKRLSTISPKESRAVKAVFDTHRCTLSVLNAALGDAIEEVPCDYFSEPLTIGFNGNFWREALDQFGGEQVAMAFADGGSPAIVIDGEDSDKLRAGEFDKIQLIQILMPCRV